MDSVLLDLGCLDFVEFMESSESIDVSFHQEKQSVELVDLLLVEAQRVDVRFDVILQNPVALAEVVALFYCLDCLR